MNCLLCLTLMFTVVPPMYTENLNEWTVFVERNDKSEEVRHYFRAEENRFRLRTEMEDGEEEQSYIIDEKGETVAWEYRDPGRGIILSAELTPGRVIRCSGQYRGKPFRKDFRINHQPWNQRFQQGLSNFLQSGQQKTVFWTIGTRGKGEMKITRFTAKRETRTPPPDMLSTSAFKKPFQHIKMSLHGMLSLFWTGRYWYDAKGNFLYYEGKSSHLDGRVVILRQKETQQAGVQDPP